MSGNGLLKSLGLYVPQEEEISGDSCITRSHVICSLQTRIESVDQLIRPRKVKRAQSWERIKMLVGELQGRGHLNGKWVHRKLTLRSALEE
jgi:hypothetical protein